MPNYRTFDHLEADYFRAHPEEINPYLSEIFEAFAEDNDAGALLASLRVVAQVQGLSALAQETGLSRQGLQKALSEKGNPRLESVNSILHALGYRLVPQELDTRM